MKKFALCLPLLLAAAVATAADPVPAGVATPPATSGAKAATTFVPPSGYRRQVISGTVYYCKNTVVLGSKLPKRVCLTEEQAERMQKDTSAFIDNLNQSSAICVNPANCGGN